MELQSQDISVEISRNQSQSLLRALRQLAASQESTSGSVNSAPAKEQNGPTLVLLGTAAHARCSVDKEATLEVTDMTLNYACWENRVNLDSVVADLRLTCGEARLLSRNGLREVPVLVLQRERGEELSGRLAMGKKVS